MTDDPQQRRSRPMTLGNQRRVDVRYPTFITTEIVHGEELHLGALSDVSASGGFIESNLPLDVGTPITIQFKDGHEAKGMVFLHYSLPAKIATVVTRAGLVGFGFTWEAKTDDERVLLKRLIADVKERKLPKFSVEAQTSRRWALLVAVMMGFYGFCVAFDAPFWRLEPLHRVPHWRWPLGIVGVALLVLAMTIALRRRGQLGTRGRGAYGRWLAFHALFVTLGFVALGLHVCERRGDGIPLYAAILVAAVSVTALPRLWTWKQMPESRLAIVIARHWLKFHVILIGPLIVAVAWHVVQVIVF